MRLSFPLAALLAFFAFIPLSSQQAHALSEIETGDNASTIVAQVGPRAGLTVTSLADTADPGTLRDVITTANGTPEADTITFAVTGTITLLSNLPAITQPLTITGPSAGDITITGVGRTAFTASSGSFAVNISGLTLTGLNHGVNFAGPALTLTDMLISSMTSRAVTASGGSLNMTRVTVTGNAGARAIYTTNATVIITDSTVSSSANIGMEISGGSVTITGSTFANNTASGGAGAIYANGTSAATTVNITNSTFSGNISTSTTNADAIYAYENATVNISFSTFSGHSNSTTSSTTGIIHAGMNADIVLLASVIANNPAGGTPRECTAGSGATFTGSDNVMNDTVCPGRIGAPANVSATLASNGGPTRTHALLTGSTAIDAYTGAVCPATDQRGQPRPAADTDCDLGAYELRVCPAFPATIPASDVAALIFAIECANASSSDDVINLTNSTYTLTATHNTTDANNGLPQIASAATAGKLTINGSGATISGNNQRRVIYNLAGADLTLDNLTISGGYGFFFSGGGIHNSGTLTLNDSTVSSNTAHYGAGIHNSGTLTLTGSTVSDNNADYGAGIHNSGTLILIDSTVSGNIAVGTDGGGIFAVGTVTMTNSTVSGNLAGASGGGIYSNTTLMTLNNSTIYDNSASDGGGIFSDGTVVLNNSTVTGNTASTSGGGFFINAGTLTLNNSILANSNDDCIIASGTVDANYSLFSYTDACGATNGVDGNIEGDPMLGTLATAPNGTSYYPLLAGSPASNSGSNALVPADLDFDQAGNARIQGATVDMGAFESDAAACPAFPATIPAGDVAALILAIECANANFSNDVINLTSSTYTLTATHNTASGNNGLPAIANAGAAGTLTINGNGATISGNNQRRVFYMSTGANLALNNVTVTDGFSTSVGGGIYTLYGTLVLNGTTVSSNAAANEGGAVYSFNSAITLTNSTITGNGASSTDGGAIYTNAVLTVTDSTFSQNIGSRGGALNVSGAVTITGSTFSENSASNGAGAIVAYGPLNIDDSLFTGNTAPGDGGAITITSSAQITDTTFTSNSAAHGGALLVWSSQSLILTNSTLDGNSAGQFGGGLYNNGTATVTNSTIINNTAVQHGGGIYGRGTTTVNNSTVAANSAGTGGDGVYNNQFTTTLNNTILANSGEDCAIALGSVDVHYTLFSNAASCGAVDGVDGNIVGVNPLLGTLATAPNGTSYYPLNFASPAIDAGSDALIPSGVTTDQAGNSRIRQARVDMGAYESNFEACPAFPATIPDGDVAALILAIECANALPSNDVIELKDSSTYLLTATYNSLNGANGLPQIASAASAGTLTINGNGATISGNDQRRVLYVASGANVTLNELTIRGGRTTNNGGGIYNFGTVTLNRSTVRDNFSAGDGGGIFNLNTMTIVNSTITGNTTNGWGGGIATTNGNTLTLKNSTIAQNTAVSGGGLSAAGSVTVHNTILAANSATGSPDRDCRGTVTASHSLFQTGSCGVLTGPNGNIVGTNPGLILIMIADGDPAFYTINPSGVAVNAGSNALVPAGVTTDQPGSPRIQDITVDMGSYEVPAPPCPVSGDTIPAGDVATLIYAIECANASPASETFELTNSTYTLTAAYSGPNGFPIINDVAESGTLTINGNGATINGSALARLFSVGLDANLTLSDMTLTNGRVTGADSGGAISVPASTSALTLTNVTITNSFAGNRGGAIYNFGQITVADSVFTGNSATEGGAIYSARTATITGSTFSGNTATNNGGGFYNVGLSLLLTNSTLTGNTAALSGGALYMVGAGTVVTAVNSTIALNHAGGGGGIFINNGTLRAQNSIVAGNTSDTGVNMDCNRVSGTQDSTYTLFQNGACGATNGNNGNIVGVNPLLGTLATAPNGTSYYPLLAGSPAINVGSNALVPVAMTADQAGNTRIQGGTVDMGSFETNTPAFVTEINVTGNGEDIADGDTTPNTFDHTDFGLVSAGTPVTRTFTIHNTGTSALNLGSVTVPSGFTLAAPLPGSLVAAGGSTALNIQCLADTANLYVGTVVIPNDDADENPYNFDIVCLVNGPEIEVYGDGQAIANGDATPDASDNTDFGTTTTGTPLAEMFTIPNTGTEALNVGPVTVPAGFTVTAMPPASIAAGTPGLLGIRCDATAAGTFSGTVSIPNDDANENPFTFAITCNVIAPDIGVTGNGVAIASGDTTPDAADHTDFGTPMLGAPVTRTFAIENTGAGTLSLGLPSVPAGFSIALPTPSLNILSGQSTALNLQCDAAAGGTYSGTVSLPSNDPDENPYTFAITCTVDTTPPPAPDISITGNAVVIAPGDTTPSLTDHTDFGTTSLGAPVTRAFTIHNNGDAELQLTGGSMPSGFMPVAPTPDTTIAAGGSTLLSFQCPATTVGTLGGTVVIETNDPDTPSYSFAVTCEVVMGLPPDINITGNGLTIANGDTTPSLADHTNFGVTIVGTQVVRTFTIENTGDGVLNLTGIGGMLNGFTGAGGPPAITIPAGGSTTFSLACEAAAVGTYGGTLSISSTDPDENPYTFDLTCQVNAPPDINVTGSGVTIASGDTTPVLADHTDFGTMLIGSPVTRTFTIENNGTGALNISTIDLPDDFAVANPLPVPSVAVGASTALNVRCVAASAGTYTGNLVIVSNDPDESSYTFTITCQVNAAIPDVTIIETNGTTSVDESGLTDTYTVALNSQPTADVTITLTFDGQITANGSASPLVLTFSDTTPQTVTVAAVNDSLVEGPHGAAVSYSVASADSGYNGFSLTDTAVSITDNDTATFSFETPGGSISEAASPYLANVVLTIVSDPPGGTLGNGVAVDFNYGPGTGTVGIDFAMNTTGIGFGAGIGSGASQAVDVNIVNDALEEPDETFTLIFTTVTGPATASGTHEVTILDDDAPPCPASPATIPAGDVAALIFAIECANASPTDDVINLTNSTYTLTADYFPGTGLPMIASAAASGTLTINGSGATLSGNNERNVLYVDGGANLTLNGLTITAGSSMSFGGGISISLNSTVTITNSTISGSTAEISGGGVDNRGTLTITNSTISGNIAEFGNTGGILNTGTLTIANSTISGNTAELGDTGGISNDGTLTITNSIFANSGQDCRASGGTVTISHTLFSNADACGAVNGVDGNLVGVDPLLGALTGSPAYHPLLAGSPAINSGSNALVPVGLTTDQAGNVRIQGGTVDRGSFETNTPAPAVVITETGGTTSVAEGGAADTYTVVLTAVPSADVTVTLTFDGQITVNGSASPVVLTFSDTTPQTVTVAAVDDAVAEGPHSAAISYSVASADPRYNGFTLTDTVVTIVDDDPAGNLLKNPGFETAGTGITKAKKWVSGALTKKDKRVCNTATKTFSNTGDCAFRFQNNGVLTVSRVVKQTVKNPALGVKGETYTLDAMISAESLTPGAKLILQVKYANGTKAKSVISVPSGTYAYTAVETALPITRNVTWVRVKLVGGTTSGRLLIDDLVLWVEPGVVATDTRSNGVLLPLPAAPEGFRGGN